MVERSLSMREVAGSMPAFSTVLSYCCGRYVSLHMILDDKQDHGSILMWQLKVKSLATRMGFEPTRAEHNGLAVHRLNHSATSSMRCGFDDDGPAWHPASLSKYESKEIRQITALQSGKGTAPLCQLRDSFIRHSPYMQHSN